jgi:hypothetical protein
MIPDYQVLKNLVQSEKWEEALSYLNIFHAQNIGMNSLLFDWCMSMPKHFRAISSPEAEESIRSKAILNFQNLLEKLKLDYRAPGDLIVIEQMKSYFTADNLLNQKAENFLKEMDVDLKKLEAEIKNKNKILSLIYITDYHQHAVIRHDSFITFTYSYPTTIMEFFGEKDALEVANGSIANNPMWNGLWELTKVLNPVDLAAFLAEHLRYHFSGNKREGQTQIIEDDEKIRLIFDPCGSGGALRRRLGDTIHKTKQKDNLNWNKCNEVNLYCTHCALNEKHSIDLFGYPKIVVEFQADPAKPCGWTIYKDKKDIPKEVYQRLGF